jgi:8-oxo-dGTP diphosphatase
MGFEIRVVRNNPLTGEPNLDQALLTFLDQIGYLSDGKMDDAGFRLFKDCFLLNPDRPWTIDDLLTYLETNKSTLYRYLNKLKGLDVLDEIDIPAEPSNDDSTYKKTKKGYRFRFRSLTTSWGIVESHTDVALQGYRSSVDHIQNLAKKIVEGEKNQKEQRIPSLTVDGIILKKIDDKQMILLVQRKNEPYKGQWALPGGFVEYGERVEDAVLREIKEETGVECTILQQAAVASRPDRDPRGHTVSIIFKLTLESEDNLVAGDDASSLEWFSLDAIPDLAFDHNEIIDELIQRSVI